MTDLRARFREVDLTPAPDLWADIANREPGPRPSRELWQRAGVAAAAILVAALAFTYLARAFLTATSPGDEPTPTPTGVFRPEPKTNGLIAFVRTDPDSMIQEGGIPRSKLLMKSTDWEGTRTLIREGGLFRSIVSWAPDGSRIAVPGHEGIQILNADGRAIGRVTTCESPECEGDFTPSWSPDGSGIAFSRFDNFEEALWVVGADGSDAKQLNQEFVTIVHVAWSPDGTVIAVVGFAGPGPEVGAYRIYLVDAESGRIDRTLDPPPGLEFGGTISWSPDGESIAFDAHDEGGTLGAAGVYVMRSDGTERRLLTACDDRCEDMHPAWSPDGRQIAFTRALDSELGSDGFMGDIFVIDANGGEARRVTGGPGLDCCPAWQPLPVG